MSKPCRTLLFLAFFFLSSCTGTSHKNDLSPQPDRPVSTDGPLGILQGHTTENTAQFSILHPRGLNPLLFVRGFEDLQNFRPKPVEVRRFEMPHSNWSVSHATVFGLRKGQSYKLEVWTRDKFRKLDERRFTSLDLSQSQATILVASCMSLDPKFQQKQMWQQALSHQPDMIFLIGDMVYAHHNLKFLGSPTSEKLWDQYVQARLEIELYKMDPLVPILATWDDGDYGMRNGNRNNPLKAQAQTIFNSFYAQEPDQKSLTGGPGVSRLFRGFGFGFYFLDARSFRSPPGQVFAQTHWGKEQEDWLFRHLRQNPIPSFLIQGDQFFGGHHSYDSYEGQNPQSFVATMTRLRQENTPVMFLSGDRHLAEITGLGPADWPYQSFEFTTSAIHARVHPKSLQEFPNPRQVKGVDGTQNYGILQLQAQGKKARVNIKAVGPKKRTLFEQTFFISGN